MHGETMKLTTVYLLILKYYATCYS